MAKPLQSHYRLDNLFVYIVLSGKLKQPFLLSISGIFHQLFRYDDFCIPINCFFVHPTLKDKPDAKDQKPPYKAKLLQSHYGLDNILIYKVLLYI